MKKYRKRSEPFINHNPSKTGNSLYLWMVHFPTTWVERHPSLASKRLLRFACGDISFSLSFTTMPRRKIGNQTMEVIKVYGKHLTVWLNWLAAIQLTRISRAGFAAGCERVVSCLPMRSSDFQKKRNEIKEPGKWRKKVENKENKYCGVYQMRLLHCHWTFRCFWCHLMNFYTQSSRIYHSEITGQTYGWTDERTWPLSRM